jgi:hypothetical protein
LNAAIAGAADTVRAQVRAFDEFRSMSDADLKVRYNAVMAEVMRRRRAKQKGQ